LALPDPPKAPANPSGTSSNARPGATPAPPSARTTDLRLANIQLRYPDNWKPAVQGTYITLAPDAGLTQRGDVAYGMIIDVFQPQGARNLDDATSQYLDNLRKGNPSVRIVRNRGQGRVSGQVAQITELVSDSPLGGQETDVVITVLQSGALRYFVEVAPSKDFAQYDAAFRDIIDSVQLQ
jgi:hypothetical protein